MIEVVYKDEKQEAKGNEGIFSVPKNIRQIGMIGEDYRIYMEDYVYTFLRKAAGAERNDEGEKNCLAVLTGESKWASGVTYVFIKGALTVENTEVSSEHIGFSEEVWQKIQEDAAKYFEGQEITGWFFSQRSIPMEATELFQKIHLRYFGGGEKVLMLMDPAEREEAFFRYENNFLVRQSGYYLYYEKNPQMQAYMLEKNPDFSKEEHEEIEDEAVKAFRKIIRKKKKEEPEEAEDRTSVFSYAATACLVLAVAAVGMRFYQNYRGVQEVNSKTEAVSAMLENDGELSQAAQSVENDQEGKGNSAEMDTGTERTQPEISASAAQDADRETSDGEENGENSGTETENTGEESARQAEQASESGQTAGDAAQTDRNGLDTENDERNAVSGTGESGEMVSETSENTAFSGQEELSEEDEAIYRQESDMRKAERRVQDAKNSSDGAEEPDDTETAAEGSSSYVIRPGDTLYQISMEKYGTMEEVAEICRLNGISADEIIYPGQIIVLP